MTSFRKTVLVQHTAQAMFELVDDIENYPEFLPWCGKSEVLHRDSGKVDATLEINFYGVKQAFTTRNDISQGPTIMKIGLLKGPFKHLSGQWSFKPLGEEACKVEFSINYAFSSLVLTNLLGPVFEKITGTLVQAFVERANTISDKNPK
tara:strand:+ start:70 stop:516 length:447 start_codon:yes stop_codon:yes gene_type:complete